MSTLAEILLLPVQPNGKIVKASDKGTFFAIAAGESGADAVALVTCNTKDYTGTTPIYNLLGITEEGYNAIPIPDENTQHVITDAASPLSQLLAYLAEQNLIDEPTVTYDVSLGINAKWTIEGNRTLSIPTNTVEGQSGRVVITQDATGGRVLTLAAGWGLTTDNIGAVSGQGPDGIAILSWTRITSTTFASSLMLVP